MSGIGFRSAVRSLNVFLEKEPVPLREHFDNIPRTLGTWEAVGDPVKFSAEMIEELGTDLYLDRRYVDRGDPATPWLELHIAYYTGSIDAVPHVPDRCLVAGGFNVRNQPVNLPMTIDDSAWGIDAEHVDLVSGLRYDTVACVHPVTGTSMIVRLPIGDFELRTTEFSHDDLPGARIFAGYLFVANGRIAVTPEQVKRLAFQKSEKYAYYCKVQFFTVGDSDLTAERFVDRSADLLEALLPELMRCLPDWAMVQVAASEASPPDSSHRSSG